MRTRNARLAAVHALFRLLERQPSSCAVVGRHKVSLDSLNTERQLLEYVVDELDGGLLVEAVVHPSEPESGCSRRLL